MDTRQIPRVETEQNRPWTPGTYVGPGGTQKPRPGPGTGGQPYPGSGTPQPEENTAATLWGLPVWALVIAAFAGTALALVTIPAWVPALGSSIVGPEPKVYWYLSRASGFTAFVLLWVSMASGLIISNKIARIWPGGPTAFDLHQFTSLLGLGFTAFHVLILLGNPYIPYSLLQLLVPFTSDAYRPVWIAVGQVCLYIAIPVTFTFYIRKQLSYRLWHIIHFLGYAVFGLALLHSLFSGTDSGNIWVVWMYWASALSIIWLTIYRVMVSRSSTKSPVRQSSR